MTKDTKFSVAVRHHATSKRIVADTSLESHFLNQESGMYLSIERQIIAILRPGRSTTTTMLSSEIGKAQSSISGIEKLLRESGKLGCFKGKCKITKRGALYHFLTPERLHKGEQIKMFEDSTDD